MSMERILIELQERVLTLTDRVDELTTEVNQLKEAQGNEQTKKNMAPKIRGSLSKDIFITAIKQTLASVIPATAISKGSRAEGSGIVITKGTKKIKMCLRASGYYGKEDVSSRMLYTGFSTLSKSAIEDSGGQLKYDFYIFAINTSDNPANPKIVFFIFDQKQFQKLLAQKTPSGKRSMYYFYFGETVNGHFIDDREKDREVLIDKEHDNWDPVIKYYAIQ